MNYNTIAYGLYFLITLFVILRVGHLLYHNGGPFVVRCLHGDRSLAHAINRILLSCYYLLNIGYAVFMLKIWSTIHSFTEVLEMLGKKTGMILLLLGAIHFFNIITLLIVDQYRTSREARKQNQTHQY